MNNLLNIKTPCTDQAKALKADYSLSNHGLSNLGTVYWNLPTEAIMEEVVFRNEGRLTKGGALIVNTGKKTGRSANDKFIVKEATNEDKIWWGEYNRPFSHNKFDEVFHRIQGYLQGRDLFVQDCYVGADPEYRLAVRVITEKAWHSHFARNMFILPKNSDEYKRHIPDFTVIALPDFKAMPQIDATASETFILLNFEQKLGIIGGTAYAGEIKKTVFTVMNYLMPLEGVMSMHCSANQGPEGDTAIFFGLSGTGKTTLSADPTRGLIGDDEHGWSDEGVFNYEGGCYAKVIELSPTAEPQIYACTHRFGTVLENVIFDMTSRTIDLMDPTLTENTRASYPLEFIDNAVIEKRGGHPKNIILLTCDGSGVMPPIARLTPEQTMYQFISGYTTKIAGTELGLGQQPELTFSTCFGAPFMVHHPSFYAELLKNKILRHKANCWLVNTGWVGGDVTVGKRISIRYTRALLNAALSGKLDNVEYRKDEVFGFAVPMSCPDVPDSVLDPASSWHDKKLYMTRYKELASRFIDNFKKYAEVCSQEVRDAGPKK